MILPPNIIYVIYLILSVGNPIKKLTSLLITKLSHHPIIFDGPWMKKYSVLLDLINNSILFFFEYCSHLGVPSVPVFTMPTAETRIISMTT